jgi:hypothetical protein
LAHISVFNGFSRWTAIDPTCSDAGYFIVYPLLSCTPLNHGGELRFDLPFLRGFSSCRITEDRNHPQLRVQFEFPRPNGTQIERLRNVLLAIAPAFHGIWISTLDKDGRSARQQQSQYWHQNPSPENKQIPIASAVDAINISIAALAEK